MERRRLQVAMDEIIDAMTVSEDDPIRFFLDLHTGKVESRFNPDMFDAPDEADDFDQRFQEDPERFEEIPKYESRDEYTLMCRFADTIDEEDIRAPRRAGVPPVQRVERVRGACALQELGA